LGTLSRLTYTEGLCWRFLCLLRGLQPHLAPFHQARAFCRSRAEPEALALDGMSVSWMEATVWLNPP
jgi:cob(I)alamin adenosyltransferase